MIPCNCWNISTLDPQQLGIDCDYLIEKGDPKEVIYREARRDRPDLLVLGCKGDCFMSIFLPSVIAYVWRNANCQMVCNQTQSCNNTS
ncbi:Universal stress protein A-like protein [Linum perenne]